MIFFFAVKHDKIGQCRTFIAKYSINENAIFDCPALENALSHCFFVQASVTISWQVPSPGEIHKPVVMFSFYEVLLLTSNKGSSMTVIYARSTYIYFFPTKFLLIF